MQVIPAEVEAIQHGESSQLRRYLSHEIVRVQKQLPEGLEVAQRRRNLTGEMVAVKEQLLELEQLP